MAASEISDDLLKTLGRAGYVVVPKNCVAPQLLYKAMKPIKPIPTADIELTAIRQAAAERAGMRVQDLVRGGTQRRFSHARQLAMYVAREHYGKHLKPIAKSLGLTDHSTVADGVAKVIANVRNWSKREATLAAIEWISERATDLLEEADRS